MEFEVPKCDVQVNLICPFKDNRFKRSRQNLFIFRCAHCEISSLLDTSR